MATRMQQRRGTASQWTTANPILNAGEIGFESDTNKFKIGDGINHWADIQYFVDQASLNTSLGDYITSDLLGAANGVAQLNSSGLLVSSQIPNIDEITQDAINTALVAGTGLDKTYDDNANTITLDIDSTVATKSFAAGLLTGATKSNITITGDENGLTISAENGVADSTTTDLAEGTNLYFTNERAQDAVGNAVGTGLSYDDASGAISVNTTTIQARVADVSDTEIGYLNGVTSGIQSQLDDKMPKAGGTFTGTVYGTSLELSGDLTVDGTFSSVPTETLTVTNPMIYMGDGNPANLNDLGLVGSHTISGTYSHTGLVKDATDGKWKLFTGVTDEPTTTINFAQATLDSLSVGALDATSITVGDVSNTEFGYLNGVTSAIQTQLNDKAPLASPTFTGTVTIPSGAALGTPASATLTNATGLPVSTGISGLGSNVATFLATPSSANFASMITDEIGTGNVLLSDMATNAQSASYTLVLTDKAKVVEISNASANNLTVPLNSSVAFPVGTQIHVVQTGAGQTTVVATGGVTINSATTLKLRAQWSAATLIKRATDTWVLVGDLATS